MSCCSEVYNLECINHCDVTDTGFNAAQTGVHTWEIYVGMDTWQTHAQSITSGNDINIPSGVLNESRAMDMRLKQPDGTYYEWSTGVDCLRVTTQIYSEIIT